MLLGGRASRAPRIYLVSLLLVIAGLAINIVRSLSPESVGAAGALIAWVAALSVPFMKSFDLERVWRLFYRFMLWASIISIIEYVAVFAGVLPITSLDTARGVYLKGIVTLFYGLGDGSVHYRMYGLFAEPGTYAMYLLPAIAYGFRRREPWSVVLFLVCLYLTDSLGGIASLLVMGATYLFWRSRERPVGLLVAVALALVVAYSLSGSFRDAYEQKAGSASVREDNVTLFRDNFVSIVSANPYGLPLTGRSISELENVTSNYLGSNFEVYTLFVKGGILACAGYTFLLAWIVMRSGRYLLGGHREPTRATALICLPAMLLFVVQRETILASALFAFLFARPLLTFDGGARRVRRRRRSRAERGVVHPTPHGVGAA